MSLEAAGKHRSHLNEGGLRQQVRFCGDVDRDCVSDASSATTASSVYTAELLSRRTLHVTNKTATPMKPTPTSPRGGLLDTKCKNARGGWAASRATANTRLPPTPRTPRVIYKGLPSGAKKGDLCGLLTPQARVIYRGGSIASSTNSRASELIGGRRLDHLKPDCERATLVGHLDRPTPGPEAEAEGHLSTNLTPRCPADSLLSYQLTPNCLRKLAVPLRNPTSSVVTSPDTGLEASKHGHAGEHCGGCGGWSVNPTMASPELSWTGGALKRGSSGVRGGGGQVSPSPLSRLELLHRRGRHKTEAGNSSDSGCSCHDFFRDTTPPAGGSAEESREELLRKLQKYDAEQAAFQAQILKSSLHGVFM